MGSNKEQLVEKAGVNIYMCFIASPSDTGKERLVCDKVFDEINKSLGDAFGFKIESRKWEEDVRPGFSTDGQAVINEAIGEYDIFVGIMNRKFGSPTKRAGSGTEEEFNIAYERHLKDEELEIMFYFNDETPQSLSEIDPDELNKVKSFRSKISKLGGLYCLYNGATEFEDKLRKHINDFFLQEYSHLIGSQTLSNGRATVKEKLKTIFSERFENALKLFPSQPVVWVEPILSSTNEISPNPNENYKRRVEIEELLINPSSRIIKAPAEFGLTSLSHYMVKEAWERDQLWIYIDSQKTKAHNIHNAVKNEAQALGMKLDDVKCIILDDWCLHDKQAFKKLKNLCLAHKDIPIFLMERIDDSRFLTEPINESIDREFIVLHLLALPRNQIRKIVSQYNKAKGIGDEDIILRKVISDLEVLNIHRTPQNCITLLRVAEKHFDESPVNRTKMLEMVLFILFDMDGIPTYKIKPDLKDCEYVLGRYCEKLIKSDLYEFSRENFISELKQFCAEKLIDLEVEIVFDVLFANNIIVQSDNNYMFRASYWIFYFGAKRMISEDGFAEYILSNKKYIAFPEIIEFYTGIDRNKEKALEYLLRDITETCDTVFQKVGIPDNMNPYKDVHWSPTEEQIKNIQNEISTNVKSSFLPDIVKDQYADKNYDQLRPYQQKISIQSIFEEYSLFKLIQNIKASSRALRNSDYANPDLKRKLLKEILRSWEQLTKVIFALAPILATEGKAAFLGIQFALTDDFSGKSVEEKMNLIFQVVPINVVGPLKDDLFSPKMGPLIFEQFSKETDPVKKHQLALLIIYERPREWKKEIEKYIIDLPKNSYFLFDTVNNLCAKYRFDFVLADELRDIGYLIKMGLAKNHFGDKKPGLEKIKLVSNDVLPKRDDSEIIE